MISKLVAGKAITFIDGTSFKPRSNPMSSHCITRSKDSSQHHAALNSRAILTTLTITNNP